MKKFIPLLMGVALTGFAVQSQAAFQLMLVDNNAVSPTVTVEDNMAGDISPSLGAIVFTGSFGGFSFILETGLSKPEIGGVAKPEMQLTSTLSGAGDISIFLTDTGFDFGSSPLGVNFALTAGGSAGQGLTSTTSAWADDTNALFGINNPIGTIALAGTSYSDAVTSGVNLANMPYSLTIGTRLVQTGGGSSLDISLRVPEPGTLAALGLGLLALGVARRRNRV